MGRLCDGCGRSYWCCWCWGFRQLERCGSLQNVSISIPLKYEPQQHTLSRDLPLSTLSVVAAAFPPFLCRSHAMSLLLSCGNICAMVSIWAGLIRTERLATGRVPFAEGLLEYHRYTRKATTANTRTCGMFMLCSAMLKAISVG